MWNVKVMKSNVLLSLICSEDYKLFLFFFCSVLYMCSDEEFEFIS